MGPFDNFPKFCLFFEIYAEIGFYTNLKPKPKIAFLRKLNDGILMLRKDKVLS